MGGKKVPKQSQIQDPGWEVVNNKKRGNKSSLSKKESISKKTDETVADNSKRHKRRAEKRKSKALQAEANASELFDMICKDLVAPGKEVHVMFPDEKREFELFIAKLKPEWEAYRYRRLCPANRNEPLPKEYCNNPIYCTCDWTGEKCTGGPWLLVRNPKIPITNAHVLPM